MNIPAEWTEMLLAIRAVCPDAVIAGGALRDLDNDRPVRDIDIFVTTRSLNDANYYIPRLRQAGFDVEIDLTDNAKIYPEDQNLEVIAIVGLSGGPRETQIIFCNWPTARIVDRFDYGICRIAYDGSTVTTSPEYVSDKANRLFRIRRESQSPAGLRGSVLRYARLTAEKYVGWDFQPFVAESDDVMGWI